MFNSSLSACLASDLIPDLLLLLSPVVNSETLACKQTNNYNRISNPNPLLIVLDSTFSYADKFDNQLINPVLQGDTYRVP